MLPLGGPRPRGDRESGRGSPPVGPAAGPASGETATENQPTSGEVGGEERDVPAIVDGPQLRVEAFVAPGGAVTVRFNLYTGRTEGNAQFDDNELIGIR